MSLLDYTTDLWSEDDLLDEVVKTAMAFRWAVCHFRPARTRNGFRTAIQGHVGFPDLVIAKAGVVLIRELKSAKGRVSSEQFAWAQSLVPGWKEHRLDIPDDELSVLFDVWRPEHWRSRIVPTLTMPARRLCDRGAAVSRGRVWGDAEDAGRVPVSTLPAQGGAGDQRPAGGVS